MPDGHDDWAWECKVCGSTTRSDWKCCPQCGSEDHGPAKMEAPKQQVLREEGKRLIFRKEVVVPDVPGNWPEDFDHENGQYECRCCICKATFYGHKRRVVCKLCDKPKEQPMNTMSVAPFIKAHRNLAAMQKQAAHRYTEDGNTEGAATALNMSAMHNTTAELLRDAYTNKKQVTVPGIKPIEVMAWVEGVQLPDEENVTPEPQFIVCELVVNTDEVELDEEMTATVLNYVGGLAESIYREGVPC